LGPALPSPRLDLGHACECLSQSATRRLDCSQEETGQAPRGACAVRSQEWTQASRVPMLFFS